MVFWSCQTGGAALTTRDRGASCAAVTMGAEMRLVGGACSRGRDSPPGAAAMGHPWQSAVCSAKGVSMRLSVWICALLIVAAVGFVSSQPQALLTANAQEATPCPLWPPEDPKIVSWEVGQFMQWPST